MKILLVTESIPFPARNGKELPTAEIFLRISQKVKVDILVASNDEKEYQQRLKNIPSHFGSCKRIGFTIQGSRPKRILNELKGNQPSYFSKRFDVDEVKSVIGNETYDCLWISPAELFTFPQNMRQQGFVFFDKVAIGMNDLKSGMYHDAINEAIGFRTFHFPYIFKFLRSFFMKKAERAFLSNVDLIHVQSESELKKVKRLFRNNQKKSPSVVVAPNGYKNNLRKCEYSGIDSSNILYMTQLNKGRKIESKWFVENIWPKIHKEIPDAKLLIPGKIADLNDPSIAFLKNAPNVELLGFVRNLDDLLKNVRLGVVPIFHGTGLINRILDNLTAGIPSVSTPNAINTFPNLRADEHILSAKTTKTFSEQVITLYKDKGLRERLSANGIKYVSNCHPSWDESVERIYQEIERLTEKDKTITT